MCKLSDMQYFRGSILLIVSNTQYCPGLGSAYTQHYTEISGINTAYITQYADVLGWSILITLSTTQYFRGIDTAYTKRYAVFPVGRYYSYYAMLSFLWGRYCFFTKRYGIFSGVDTSFT